MAELATSNLFARMLRVARQDPLDAIDRAWQRIRALSSPSGPGAPGAVEYMRTPEWRRELHTVSGWTWPCSCGVSFASQWKTLVADGERRGLGCFHDADPVLAEAVWLLTLHAEPMVAVETGVAHGVTSRFVLTALDQRGSGHLWSIDAPPSVPGFDAEVGAAVPIRLRDRWTYVRGTSRRRLPGLVKRVGEIDLFVHDSLHTRQNVLFELDQAWDALAPGGFIVVDDIDFNDAVHVFSRTHAETRLIVAGHRTKTGAVAIISRSP